MDGMYVLADFAAEETELEQQESAISSGLSSPINYHNITHDDMLNGDGLRVVLWVAGCSHKCPGCHNPQTWDPNSGIPFTEWEASEFWEWLAKPWTQGATFSGGDPLFCSNRTFIGSMMAKVKEKYPNKDIWLYTGYTLEQDEKGFYFADGDDTFRYEALQYVDVLVDGKFDMKQREVDINNHKTCHWRGSSNQRIIDVKKTLETGNIIERRK